MHTDIFGSDLDSSCVDAILGATVDQVLWSTVDLGHPPGMPTIHEFVKYPASIAGMEMPAQRLVFIRIVTDTKDGYLGYGVESMADSLGKKTDSYEQSDFRLILSSCSLAEAESSTLDEVKSIFQKLNPQ